MKWIVHSVSVTVFIIFLRLEEAKTQTEDGVLQGRQFPLQEYCDGETFSARCEPDEVIVMTRAEYGRQATQRCITINYGNQDCKSDVLLAADALCSGLQTCQFEVDDDTFASYHPCKNNDFRFHLSAAYMCVPVHRPAQSCSPSGGHHDNPEPSEFPTISLGADDGNSGSQSEGGATRYISSEVARRTGCGSTSFPWVLKAPPSRRIELTMIDFSLNGTIMPASGQLSHQLESGVCLVYASVRDGSEAGGRNPPRSSTICGRLYPRVHHELTSSTNYVEIRVLLQGEDKTAVSSPTQKPRFLIKYQLLGCDKPVVPAGGWIRHLGDTDAVIGCDADPGTDRWHLTCEQGRWKGVLGNCSEAETAFLEQFVHSVQGLPFGLSLALVIAIAFVVSCLILLIGICIITKRNIQRQQDISLHTTEGQQTVSGRTNPKKQSFSEPKSAYHVIKSNQSDNMYTDADSSAAKNGAQDVYALRSEEYVEKYPGYGRQSSSGSPDYFPTSEHIYEYPSPEKLSLDYNVMQGSGGNNAHYFDVDPGVSVSVVESTSDPSRGQTCGPPHHSTVSTRCQGSANSRVKLTTGTGSHVINQQDNPLN